MSAITASKTSSSASTTSSSSESGSKLCIICAGPASDKIVRDNNFQMMMDLYWKGIRVDVKPDMNKTFHLCIDCFDSVLQFYQINDVLVYFEARLKELQRGILSTNLKGIIAWQDKGQKLHKVHTEIMREWGTKLEPLGDGETTKKTLDGYKVEQSREDEENDDQSQESNSSSKRNSDNSGKASSQLAAVKTSPGIGKRNQSHGKQKGGPTRKRLRRGRLEESDEESNNDSISLDLSSDEDKSGKDRITRKTVAKSSSTGVDPTLDKECSICLDKFGSFSALQKHLRQHKVGENEGYECLLCWSQFNRQPKLVEHKKTCRKNDDDDSDSIL